MKNAIIAVTVCLTIVFSTVIVAAIQTRSNVQEELTTAVDSAINTTERVLYDGREEFSSNQEYLNEFNYNLKELLEKKNSSIVYEVDVYGIDYEKGLIDVEVRAKYKNIIGSDRECSVRKTMIIEKIVD